MIDATAIIPTRGNVDLTPILESLTEFSEILVWKNGYRLERYWPTPVGSFAVIEDHVPDLSVYGRYAAIQYAKNNLIYTQDDDCVIAAAGEIVLLSDQGSSEYGQLVCNVPESRWPEFPDWALIGWGAAFHRELSTMAFNRFYQLVLAQYEQMALKEWLWRERVPHPSEGPAVWGDLFLRECDTVFTTLTPCMKVDVGFSHLPWAEGPGRMFTDDPAQHRKERQQMLALARGVRDA